MPACRQCRTENPSGVTACAGCGEALGVVCPGCGFESPAGFAFCGGCGSPLGEREEEPRLSDPGERRHLTVMFCDLVNSTVLSEALDPESLREVVREYQRVASGLVERYGGTVAQYLGDGLLVYFGYPTAHEDDPQRAVRAGLDIARAVDRLQRDLAPELRRALAEVGPALAVRVGIHTGVVVVGEMGGGETRERLALGPTPNIAARLQGLAEPGSVVVSDTTAGLADGFFAFESTGSHRLKGISRPVEVFRVTGAVGVPRRFTAATRRGLTPLVDRTRELATLRRCWREASEGAGQGLLVLSEAGMGKSRLVAALEESLGAGTASVVELQCSSLYVNSALYPVVDLLRRSVLEPAGDDPDARLEAVEALLRPLDVPARIGGPLLATLLELDAGDRYSRLDLTPQRRNEQTLEMLAAWLLSTAREAPALIVFEDLHWIDPTTLRLLELVLERIGSTRVLLVLTARPGLHPDWRAPGLETLTLERLPSEDVETMVRTVRPGVDDLPAQVVRDLVAKSDGVPLFAEELTKTVLDSSLHEPEADRVDLSALSTGLVIPARLYDSLLARLDRLGPAKQVAQLGAVVGREFTEGLIWEASGRDREELRRDLDRLVEVGLLVPTSLDSAPAYSFSHALVQDAAYETMLKAERRPLHRRIAEVIEASSPSGARPELLGHHWTEGGEGEKGARCWLQAGRQAYAASANLEAVHQVRRGLALLDELPETPERHHLELDLQMTLGPALMALQGFSAPEVVGVYQRIHDLCVLLDETPRQFAAVWGLLRYYAVGAHYRTAGPLTERLLRLGRESGDPAALMEALRSAGAMRFHRGELGAARRHLEEGIALYEAQDGVADPFQFLQHPGLGCRSYAAWVFWYQGYPDRALAVSRDSLALGRDLGHPYNLVFALAIAGLIRMLRREGAQTMEIAREQMALSREHGFAIPLASAHILHGGALVAEGALDEGIDEIREGLDAFRATGAGAGLTMSLGVLADACFEGGRIDEGLEALAQAFEQVERTGERFNEAELIRIEGELLRLQGDDAMAEERFVRAVERARDEGARSLELRGLTSLARLRQEDGRADGSGRELAALRAWFTEGADTHDLREADALLRAIGGG